MSDHSNSEQCRICLNYGATYPLFSDLEEEQDLHLKLSKCFHEKIENVDGFPEYICLQCKTTVETVCEFIELYKKNQKILNERSLEVKSEVLSSDGEENSLYYELLEEFTLNEEKYENNEESLDDNQLDSQNLSVSEKMPVIDTKVKNDKKQTNKCKIAQKPKSLKDNKNKKIASSILEAEFNFVDDQWCLSSEKTKSNNAKIVKKKLILPKSISKNISKLCHMCGETFTNIDILRRHVRRKHSKESVKCPKCDKMFVSEYYLMRHIKRVHDSNKEYICDQCSKKFAFKKDLNMHIKNVHFKHLIPKKIYKCTYCDKEYKCIRSKIVHERSLHTGQRPAQCTYCDACFLHNDYLKEHMRLHTGEAPFKCPICGRGHAQRCNMKSHLRIHKLSELDETARSKMRPNWLKLLKKC